MSIDEDVVELGVALARKLKRYGQDIRDYRKRPERDQDAIEFGHLKAKRKVLDQTYSACCQNQKESDPHLKKRAYDAHKATYTLL